MFIFGRQTYFGRTPQVIEQRCLEYQYTQLGRLTYFGQCHFSMLEWLEYIFGEITWNNMWGSLLLQEKLWQCWYVIKVVIWIMILLGWLFQKDSWIKLTYNTRREKTACVTLHWRSHTYKNGHNRYDKFLKQYHTFI